MLLGTASIWAAYFTGNNFFSSGHFDNFSAKIQDRIATHQSYARTLRWITTGFAVVTVVATWLHSRTGPTRIVLGALVVLTGDAGAQAVWGK